jgi:predicted metal-binding membrane protein
MVHSLRSARRRPTLWVELMIAIAWLALLAGEAVPLSSSAAAPGSEWSTGPLWICATGLGKIGGAGVHPGHFTQLGSSSLVSGAPMWGLMALAMMVPTAMPAVHHVAGKSLYWRRRRAAAEFVGIFLALWIAFCLLALGPLAGLGPSGSPIAFAVALAAAAVWQLTPLKLRALRACHRSRPLPPHGWRASAGVARFALRNGTACLASCWAMMAAAAFAGAGRLISMGALAGLMTVEKLADKPRTACRRVAALLSTAAAGVAATALLL